MGGAAERENHMSARVVRTSLAVVVAAGLTACAAPAASASTLTLTASPAYAIAGQTLTLKVTSDTAGPIEIRQVRRNRGTGPGRCPASGLYWDTWISSPKPLRTIEYPTPGTTVTVRIPVARTGLFGGNLIDDLRPQGAHPEDECRDGLSQYTRIGAFQEIVSDYNFSSADRPFTRLI